MRHRHRIMKTCFKFCFFFAALFAVASCKKSNTPNPTPGLPQKKDTDVYVVGDIVAKNGKQIAVYWKNGVLVKLTDSSQNSFALAIAISGNDVYISGSLGAPVYWKNGVVNGLPAGASTKSIAVSGTDIYLISSGTPDGLYWKNGTSVAATGNLSSVIIPYAITLNGSDVYVSGISTLSDNATTVATYWKNGVEVQLSNTLSSGFGIAVDGNDVYVAGGPNSATPIAGYWKNGNRVDLASSFSVAYDIAINGSDVYVGGVNTLISGITGVACYWKNGVANNMVNGSLGSYAQAITLNGNDVYLAGRQDISAGSSSSRPLYWKNSKPVLLPYNVEGEALGIAVVVH